jgi:hypothetical protein
VARVQFEESVPLFLGAHDFSGLIGLPSSRQYRVHERIVCLLTLANRGLMNVAPLKSDNKIAVLVAIGGRRVRKQRTGLTQRRSDRRLPA